MWKYPGEKASWYFVSLPREVSDSIATLPRAKGWGSRKVMVRVGAHSWETAIFPDKRTGFLLPLKKEVRQIIGAETGKDIDFILTLIKP